MTPAEFRSAREALGLSAQKMGAALGVDGRQVRRYEAGEAQVPLLAARVLGLLTGKGEASDRVRELFGLAGPEIPPGPTEQRQGGEAAKPGEGAGGERHADG
jgi:transcriptional regulator with XRE-family HTH domain